MFRVDKSLASLDGASLDDLVDLYVSKAPVRVAPDGNPQQLCDAFVSSFQKNNFISVYICLRLTESAKTIFYVPDNQQVSAADGSRVADEAGRFLSSYGFVMERVNPEARLQTAKQLLGLSANSSSAPKYVPPQLEVADPSQVFCLEPTLDVIEYVALDEIVFISRSAATVALPVKGLPPQTAESYICVVDGGETGVYVAIRLTESKKNAIFLPTRTDNPQDIERNRLQAASFLTSLGFRMDEINIRLSPAMREVVIKNIPFLKKVPVRTRQLVRRSSAEDPFGGTTSALQDPFQSGATFDSYQHAPGADPFGPGPVTNSFQPAMADSFQPAPMTDHQEWDRFAIPTDDQIPSTSVFGGGSSTTEPFFSGQPSFGVDAGEISFAVQPGSGAIEVGSPEDVIEIQRSIGAVRVSPPGYTTEESDAYVFSIRNSGGISVYAALYLTQSKKGVIYLPDRQPSSTTPHAIVIASAVGFLESIGFMMDVVDVSLQKKAALLAEIPVFNLISKGGEIPVAQPKQLSATEKAIVSVTDTLTAPQILKDDSSGSVSSFTPVDSWGDMTSLHSSEPVHDVFSGFEFSKSVSSVEVQDPMDLLDIYRSLSPSAIASEGFPSQPGDAYVLGIRGSEGISVLVALFLKLSGMTLLYLPKNKVSDQSSYRGSLTQGIHFVESIGFMMDQVVLPNDQAKREAVMRAIPIFRSQVAPPAEKKPVAAPPVIPKAAPTAPDRPLPPNAPAPPAVKKMVSDGDKAGGSVAPPVVKIEGEGRQATSVSDQLTRILGSF